MGRILKWNAIDGNPEMHRVQNAVEILMSAFPHVPHPNDDPKHHYWRISTRHRKPGDIYVADVWFYPNGKGYDLGDFVMLCMFKGNMLCRAAVQGCPLADPVDATRLDNSRWFKAEPWIRGIGALYAQVTTSPVALVGTYWIKRAKSKALRLGRGFGVPVFLAGTSFTMTFEPRRITVVYDGDQEPSVVPPSARWSMLNRIAEGRLTVTGVEIRPLVEAKTEDWDAAPVTPLADDLRRTPPP